MPALLIDDGFTVTATLKRGRWPEITFTYRPALPEASDTYQLEAQRAQTGADRTRAATGLLLKHLVSWDAQLVGKSDEDGTAPLSAESLRRLPPIVRDALVDVVCGYGLADWESARGNS